MEFERITPNEIPVSKILKNPSSAAIKILESETSRESLVIRRTAKLHPSLVYKYLHLSLHFLRMPKRSIEVYSGSDCDTNSIDYDSTDSDNYIWDSDTPSNDRALSVAIEQSNHGSFLLHLPLLKPKECFSLQELWETLFPFQKENILTLQLLPKQ